MSLMGPVAPATALAEAAPEARRLVRALRLWLADPDGPQAAWNALAAELGAGAARPAMRALEAFLWAVAQGARGPLTRHAPDCPTLGRDEARLAALVAAAAEGGAGFDRACALARPLVRPEATAAVVGVAGLLGAALRRAPPTPHVLH